ISFFKSLKISLSARWPLSPASISPLFCWPAVDILDHLTILKLWNLSAYRWCVLSLPYKLIDGKIESLTFTAEQVMRRLKEDRIKFIDLQFTGLFGRFHHTTMDSKMFRVEDFTDGLPKLDGSSIRGFTEIHESDLII